MSDGRPAHERAHEYLHRLWTKAVGKPGYDKKEWLELDRAISEMRGSATGTIAHALSVPSDSVR